MILRHANINELNSIWEILQQAIAQRKKDGSDQWQNGYPSEQTVIDDIQKEIGYVLVENNTIIAYAAIIFGIEPTYIDIKGHWLSNDDCVVVHRVATAESHKGKGIATQLFLLIEDLCIKNNVFSIKVDTNFDNAPMLRILEKLNYTYCGDIFFSGASRMAYEKLLINPAPLVTE
jgi:GNAT superfamily N-acetyltransferase